VSFLFKGKNYFSKAGQKTGEKSRRLSPFWRTAKMGQKITLHEAKGGFAASLLVGGFPSQTAMCSLVFWGFRLFFQKKAGDGHSLLFSPR